MLADGRIASLSWPRQAWVERKLQNQVGHLWWCAVAPARCVLSQSPAAARARSPRSYVDCVHGGRLCCPATRPAVGALIWKTARELRASSLWLGKRSASSSFDLRRVPHASYDACLTYRFFRSAAVSIKLRRWSESHRPPRSVKGAAGGECCPACPSARAAHLRREPCPRSKLAVRSPCTAGPARRAGRRVCVMAVPGSGGGTRYLNPLAS